MAVYTRVSAAEVTAFLGRFGLVRLHRLHATDAGIENTNYFVDAETADGTPHSLVLTLFERGSDGLPYFIALTTYLAAQGLPVPAPWCDSAQQALHWLKEKPVLLVPRLPGQHPAAPCREQCHVIGVALARMHGTSAGFPLHRDNDRGPPWRLHVAQKVAPLLPAGDRDLLWQQVQRWQAELPALASLPAGITHGDLFHDNALFDGNRLTGIIDFYNACTDLFIYDLAVLVNDWCSDPDSHLDTARVQAVLDGYQSVRPLQADEQAAWPRMLGYAALRFWLSRLENWHFPTAATRVSQKDPEPMRRRLLRRIG